MSVVNLFAVLLTGLFAGGLSCAAVQGGLLTGLLSRQRSALPVGVLAVARGTPATRQVARQPSGGAWRRLGDDAVPVAAFLAGKLLSHALLGLLLGAVGAALTLSLQVRTVAQLAAGALVVVFGLAQLGVRGFRGLVIEPPASWTRLVRGRARSRTAFAPAILGFATVLIPCGVTLSVMALAVASGSALAGAATMAVFVAGTCPLFAALGMLTTAVTRARGVWQRRLTVATGVLLVGFGVYTVNGGLELTGSPLSASRIADAVGLGPAPVPIAADPAVGAGDGGPVSVTDGRQTVVITARTGAYTPANVQIQAGLPTVFVVRAARAQGCVRSFVIPALKRQWTLPVNGDTRIELGTVKAGTLHYSCGMGMYTGRLTITERPA
jgi:sulfite exporter TauE/SafE